MTKLTELQNTTNLIYGAVATIGITLFGKYWFLFLGFLAANVVDYVTGYIKAKYYLKNESSNEGAKGIFKKVWYWIVICIAFFISAVFNDMGSMLGIDLSFVFLFGYFTLATYVINELRSILENIVQMGANVPGFLIKGLEIVNKKVDDITNSSIEDK
ncbi:toxin secretion/phage lysis holin [Lachnotalea glycerini]|uniref:Toxin secretion/phage lysis holin n=1 Tax=Lachnotalea glycerini TaxID=1763509 RepID=A0A318EJJ5_9FIRM|nr:phage holin family protein [Lachnotalea glycerini]PXV85405.1 toxin secretion/phage lysis holin [Lachnotalea glycerini]